MTGLDLGRAPAPVVVDVTQPARPCCVCPPECADDESGATCIAARCEVCLHDCPGMAGGCCMEQPDEPVAVLTEGEAGRTATPDHPVTDGGSR